MGKVNVLTAVAPHQGHAWRVAAEGPVLRTRCGNCSILFREYWESKNTLKCEGAIHEQEQGPCGAD